MPIYQTTYTSRRSPVLTRNAMVATSHPLAANAGLDILKQGGNAADAAVAVAAVLNVVEPMSTGIGGDCFALYYDAATGSISALNGSGRAPAALTLEDLRAEGLTAIPDRSPHAVTVPGTVQAWADLLARHGRMSLRETLAPAIAYAEDGYPVSRNHRGRLGRSGSRLPPSGRPARLPAGQGHPRPPVRSCACPPWPAPCAPSPSPGRKPSTTARSPKRSPRACRRRAGAWRSRTCTPTAAVGKPQSASTTTACASRDPLQPNGQGLAALLALNIIIKGLEGAPLHRIQSEVRLHLLIKAMRLAFEDARHYVCNPVFGRVPLEGLLSNYAIPAEQRALTSPERTLEPPGFGQPEASSDTVYLTVVDAEGNACSFINSLYMGFGGLGLVVRDAGIVLQNRGALFSLNPGHANRAGAGQAPGPRDHPRPWRPWTASCTLPSA